MAYLGERAGTPAPGTAHMHPAYYRDTYMRGGQLVLHDNWADSRATHSPLLLARARARARVRARAADARAAYARASCERLRPTMAWNPYSAPWSAQEPASARLSLGSRWVDEPHVPFGAAAGDGSELIDGLTRRLHIAVDAPTGAPTDWALSNATTIQSPMRPNPFSHADSRRVNGEEARHDSDLNRRMRRPSTSGSGVGAGTNRFCDIHQLSRSNDRASGAKFGASKQTRPVRPHTAPAAALSAELVMPNTPIRSRKAFRELRQRCLTNAMTRTDAKSRRIAELAASIEHARSALCQSNG